MVNQAKTTALITQNTVGSNPTRAIFKNTKAKGNVVQFVIMTELMRRGYTVLMPIGDNNRYDFIIDEYPNYTRVQCKTGRYQNGAIIFKIANGIADKKRYEGQVDLFGVYCFELNKIYFVPISEVPEKSSEMYLRHDTPKYNRNGNRHNLNWAYKYDFATLNNLT